MTRFAFAALAVCLVLPVRPAASQEVSLADARRLYESAAYEEALRALDEADGLQTGALPAEAHLLRSLTLVALGREDDARGAMRALIEAEPEFVLGADAAAPHVRRMFESERQRHLPAVLRSRYADGRSAYSGGDFVTAASHFERLGSLIDAVRPTLPDAEAASLAELRELAEGFHELSLEQIRAESPAVAGPAGSAPAPPVVDSGETPPDGTPVASGGRSGDRDQPTGTAGSDAAVQREDTASSVTPPVAISQEMPAVVGVPGMVRGRLYRGAIEIDIDPEGAVTAARVVQTIHVVYDARLIDAAKRWRYEPALRDGVPVAYSRVVLVTLDLRE